MECTGSRLWVENFLTQKLNHLHGWSKICDCPVKERKSLLLVGQFPCRTNCSRFYLRETHRASLQDVDVGWFHLFLVFSHMGNCVHAAMPWMEKILLYRHPLRNIEVKISIISLIKHLSKHKITTTSRKKTFRYGDR